MPVAVVGYTLYVQVQSIITQVLGKNPWDPSTILYPSTTPHIQLIQVGDDLTTYKGDFINSHCRKVRQNSHN